MADDTTDKSGSKINSWVTSHKKAIIGAAILFGIVIIYMIAKHSTKTQTSGTGSVNTQAANSAIPSTGGPYYGGGEGGYAASNNFGQIQQQLASINTALGNLSNQSSTPTGSTSGTSGSSHNNPPPIRQGPAIQPATVVKNPGFNLNGLTVSQAENLLAQQGGSYYVSNVSYNGQNYSPGSLPANVAGSTITSFTPYSSGGVRVN